MKPETRFWHWLEGALPEGDYSRVEPPPSPGIPDVNGCINGTEFWIELKVGTTRRCPFNGIHKGLRLSQRRWIGKRVKYHGRVFVFVAIKGFVFIFDGATALTLTTESPLQEFQDKAINVLRRIANDDFKMRVRKILTEWTPT